VIPAGARPEPGAQAAKRAVILYGPTAGGKSALAIELAARLDGVIINADSLQLYAELEILTARPDAEALRQAPHRLYGTLPAAEAGSAARWRDWALAEIATALDAGKLPIVTGGTGLYLTALVQGLSPLPSADEAARAEATALYARLGGAAFRAALGKRDPAAAARLEPGDRQRLIRAWEVLEATGIALSDWQARPREPGHDLDFRMIGLLPPREDLYARIDGRFLGMIARGALDEARRFAELGLARTLPANRALGLPELRSHLAGEIGLDRAIAAAQQASRNYAKRQMTWFRHQMPKIASNASTHNSHASFSELSERTIAEIIPFILFDA
jgi:tRNA dimethylallyltransferase